MIESDFEVKLDKSGLLKILEKAGYVVPPIKDDSYISIGVITPDKERIPFSGKAYIEVLKL